MGFTDWPKRTDKRVGAMCKVFERWLAIGK